MSYHWDSKLPEIGNFESLWVSYASGCFVQSESSNSSAVKFHLLSYNENEIRGWSIIMLKAVKKESDIFAS